jgi:hypothetical protein
MTLPVAGNPISFEDLNTDRGIGATTQINLNEASVAYGVPDIPNSMSELFGRGKCVSYVVTNPDANYSVMVYYLPCDSAGTAGEDYASYELGPGDNFYVFAQENKISAGGGEISVNE